jgi:hypothetical protein
LSISIDGLGNSGVAPSAGNAARLYRVSGRVDGGVTDGSGSDLGRAYREHGDGRSEDTLAL